MAKGTFDKIDLTQKDTPNNLSYEGLNTSVDYQRPKAGLLKQILEKSQESQAFSPYKKQTAPTPIKPERKTAAPAPMPVQAKPIITEDVLEPITKANVEANQDLKTAINNTVAKKFRTGVMPEDVYRTNLAKGVQSGDFKITEDAEGNKEIIRSAPSVISAIKDGFMGWFDALDNGMYNYNPFISEEDKIKDKELRRRQNQLAIEEEASKVREYGGMAGGVLPQVIPALLTGGASIELSAGNSALQSFLGALSQGGQSEDEAYNIARDNGLDEKDAYDISKVNRFTYVSSGALEGAISGLADAQIGKAFSAASKTAGNGFLNATKAYLQKAKEPAASLALDASVAGLMSSIRDLATETVTGKDLNVLERALDNAKGELIAGGAIATISAAGGAAGRKIDKWYKSQATNYLSTLDRNFVEQELKAKQAEGAMTEQQVKDEMAKIDEWNKIRKDNPNVPEEKQPTIYGLILAKKQLTESLKNADESGKPQIEQQIQDLNKRINDATTNPEPLAGEVDEDGIVLTPKAQELTVQPEVKDVSNKINSYASKNPTKINDSGEITGGLFDLKIAAIQGDKKPSIQQPSKIPFLPESINLVHLARNESDAQSIIDNGFNVDEVNMDSPIPGVYFSSEDWSAMDRFGRDKKNALLSTIKNDGLIYFDNASDFRKFLQDNNLPSEGQTLTQEQLNLLKEKGIKGIVFREDFASQSKNELIVIDPSIIQRVKKYGGEAVTEMPSSFSDAESISKAYEKAKKDGSNPDLVNKIDKILKKEQDATTISEGQKQEGPTTSNISQYQGVEGEQAPTTNEADNSNRPVSSETQQEVIPESFNNKDGLTAWNTAKKVQEESVKRGRKPEAVRDNVIANFKKSKAFEMANDVTREQMLRDLDTELFGTKQKSAPSVGTILGAVKKMVTVDEATALRRLLKRQEQASRETSTWIKDTRQSISKGLAELARRGTIKTAQLQSILKKYDAINLSNNEAVDKFVEYVSNVIKDANYDKQLSDANRFRSLIKKYAKSKVGQQNLSATAKAFLSIDPSKTQDLPRYSKVANAIINGIKPTRRTGTEVSFSQPFNTESVQRYVEAESAKQQEAAKASKLNEYQDLVDRGVISMDMSFDEMESIINAIEAGQPTGDIKDKSRYIRAYVNKRFGTLSAIAKSILTNGTDGFSKVDFTMSKQDKARIEELLKVGIDKMKLVDAYRAIESLSNFVTNGETSGLDAVLAGYEGEVNSEAFAKKYPKAESDKTATDKGIKEGRFKGLVKDLGTKAVNAFLENFSSVPVYLNTIFGDTKATEFKEKSGFNGVENGRARAVTTINKMVDDFVAAFDKKKPNGKDFSSQDNVFERGMYAFVRRNLGLGDKQNQAEFENRKKIAQNSIQQMRDSGGDDAKLAEIYQGIYDNILKDAKTIEDVEAKVHPDNKEAVDWWTSKWAEHYPELKDVSLSVYNQDLGNHNRYNPDIYKKLKKAAGEDVDPFENGSFASFAENIPAKKSGVLMKSNQLTDVPAGRYVDFNFDYNNSKAMDRALTDIYTAKDIKKLKSFVKSSNYGKIFNSPEQADLALSKMKNFIVKARGFDYVDPSNYTELRKTFNGLNTIVASRSLASLWAPIKQTIPTLTNTIVNAGMNNVKISDMTDPDVLNFIQNSGRSIANRGLDAEGMIESTNKILDRESSTPLSKLGSKIVDINKWWLQKTLGNFDRQAAIISFMAYYRQSLKEQGIDPSTIDWKTHKINDFAADYANSMVDVQQNVTERALAGEFMSSRDNTKTFIRNTLMPFGSFNINQKARMISDIVNANSKTNTLEDRKKARRSLYALTAEMTVFASIKAIQMVTYTMAANALAGVVMGEKEKEDLYKKALKGITTNMFNDVFSPLPFTDAIVDKGINSVLNATVYKDTPQELRFNLYQGDNKDEFDNFGFTGIGLKKLGQAKTMLNEGISGEVTRSYFGKDYVQKIADEDKDLAASMAVANVISQLGIIPSLGLPNATMKAIENKAMNKQQKEAYDAIKGLPTAETPVDVKVGIAKAAGYKDPESRAKYLVELYKKGGEKFLQAMEAADNAETASGKNPLAKILDDATAANVTAIISKDADKMSFARLFSNKTQEARVFKMMDMKKKMTPEQFYNTLKWGMGYGLLNEAGLGLFGKKLRETVKEDSPEYQMAIKAIEEE